MGILKNLGLLILLALFAGGGYLVRDAFIKFDQLEAYKSTPELASLPEAIQVRLNAQEEEIAMLKKKSEKGEKATTEEIEILQEKIEGLEADNAKYFEELTVCEAKSETVMEEPVATDETETTETVDDPVTTEEETLEDTTETPAVEANTIISPSLESVLEEIEKAKQETQN